MLKPGNLGPGAWQHMESSGGEHSDASAYLERQFLGRVLVAWGDARWSRTQLLGEIARGHWGLGKASVCELTAGPSHRWSGLDDRLCFSPVTEMTVSIPSLLARPLAWPVIILVAKSNLEVRRCCCRHQLRTGV
jgi:hypothetical protein